MEKFKVTHSNWWRLENGKLLPNYNRRKMLIGYTYSETDARQMCENWNKSHNPGKLSNKAEYQSIK